MLIGVETLALVGAAVSVGEERLLELKGKSELVVSYPLATVLEGQSGRMERDRRPRA